MARVLIYKRAVDAVLTDTHTTPSNEILNDAIKKEVIDDEASNHTIEQPKLVSDRSNISECNESLLSKNDISGKEKYISNNGSENSDHISQVNNLRRKRTSTKNELDISLKPKKRRSSHRITQNINKDIDIYNLTINKNLMLTQSDNSKFKKHKKPKKSYNKSYKCKVCFVYFSSSRCCSSHQLYYKKVGNYNCHICKKQFLSYNEVRGHISLYHNNQLSYIYPYFCHFCTRSFNTKLFLQSHLFHTHEALIYSNTTLKPKNHKNASINISAESDILQNDKNGKTCLNNSDKSKEPSTSTNKDTDKLSCNDNMMKTNKSITESSSNEISPSKKLRQPTLTEYLEICKKKCYMNTTQKRSNILDNSSPIHSLPENRRSENISKTMALERVTHNEQVDSATTSSSYPTQINSDLKQNSKLEEFFTKPLVRLHADVEMMKCFFDNLPDKITENETIGSQNNNQALDHEMPYQLRSKCIVFKGKYCTTRKKSSNNVFKIYPLRNRKMKQNSVNLNNANFNSWSAIMAQFNCKDCTIFLRRCDDKTRNHHPVTTTETEIEQNISPITELSSMPLQKSEVQNNVIMKKLEISVERLASTSAINDTEAKVTSVVKKQISNSYLCKVCKASFPSKMSKRMHIKLSHVAYMSSICEARFTVKSKLLQHYLSKHLVKKYQCCVCNESYDSYITLKLHLNVHCLRYIQTETDKYPIDTETKCSLIKNTVKCPPNNKICLSESFYSSHYSDVTVENDHCFTETSTVPKLILKMPCSTKTDTIAVTHDENTQHDSCKTPNTTPNKESVNKPDNAQTSTLNKDNAETLTLNKDNAETSTLNKDNAETSTLDKDNTPTSTLNKDNVQTSALDKDKLINKINEESLLTETNKENAKISEDNQSFYVSEKMKNTENVNESRELTNEPNTSVTMNHSANISISTDKTVLLNNDLNSENHPCNICGKQFYKRKNLEQHLRTFNSSDVCPICKTSFGSKRLLQSHITAAHVPQLSSNYNFHCMFCNQGFLKKPELRIHVLHLHSQQMLEIISPHIQKYKKKNDESNIQANDELNIQANDESNNQSTVSSNQAVTCSVCKLVFETLDRYVEHRMYYYQSHKFTCSICKQDFQGMYMYHHHYKLVHYSEAKRKSYEFVCDICKEGFNHELHFYSHNMHLHSNKKNLTEPAEDYEAINQNDLILKTKEKLQNLFVNHQKHIEKLGDTYFCQICHLKFANANDIENHMLQYSNNGDFKCTVCNKQCKTVDFLEQHKKLTHTSTDNDNKHLCHICGEILSSVISLKSHEKHLHPIEIFCDNTSRCENCGEKLSSNVSKKHQCTSSNFSTNLKANNTKYNCFYCDMNFNSYHMIQMHIVEVHFNKLAEHLSLKYEFVTFGNNTQQQACQQQACQQQFNELLALPNKEAQSIEGSNDVPNSTSVIKYTSSSNMTSSSNKDETIHLQADLSNEIAQKVPSSVKSAIISGSEVNNSTKTVTELNDQPKLDQPKASTPAQPELLNQVKKLFIMYLSKPSSAAIAQALKETPTSTNKSSVSSTSSSSTKSAKQSETIARNSVLPISQNTKIINPEVMSLANYTDYSTYVCPFCTLKYPSLIFFHAHLRYAHIQSVRPNMVPPNSDLVYQKIFKIECLLCSVVSNNEILYKKHLYFHLQRLKSQNMSGDNNASNSLTIQKDGETKNKTPEIITIDDDENNDNHKISSVERRPTKTVVASNTPEPTQENQKIGKLKVKSFAKIIENLSANRNLDL